MTTKLFTLPSPYDKLPLAGVITLPDGEIKGIVQFVHGMAEHKGRYEEIAAYLAERGYLSVCHDHRGHGESIERKEDLGYFGDRTGRAVVDDTVAVTKYIKGLYPALPLTLVGHSMGALVARCYLQKRDVLCDKLVVCGSPSQNGAVGVAIALTKLIRLFCGERHRSKLLKYLSTGKGAKKFESEGAGAWLSTNRESVECYKRDDRCGFLFTCDGNEGLFCLLRDTYKAKLYEVKNPDLPIYFVAGEEDPVIVSEKKWKGAMEFLRKVGYRKVTGKLYEGMRHEIFNEIGREQAYADLVNFIEG